MAGLRAIGYNFDNDDYHSFVHGRLPYEVLRTLLISLLYRKLIFSNGDKVHVAKTLGKLGLKDCFEGVIWFETLNPISDNEDPKSTGCRMVFDHSCLFDAGSALPVTPVVCEKGYGTFVRSVQGNRLTGKSDGVVSAMCD